jgi:hypothetical protein
VFKDEHIKPRQNMEVTLNDMILKYALQGGFLQSEQLM